MYFCSIEAAMDVIGGKWKPHIHWKIKDAPLRLGAIQEKLPAISPKMLTRQLPGPRNRPPRHPHGVSWHAPPR